MRADEATCATTSYHTATGTTPKQLVNTVRVSSATSAGVGHLIQLLATPPVPRDRRTLPAGPCDAVTMAVPRILGVALRECPQLPPTIAGRIKDYRAQNVADCVMYRNALASAAEWGWPVHWYDAKSVLGAASQVLRVENLDAHFLQVRRAVGPPWDKDHKLAMVAAIVTASAVVE